MTLASVVVVHIPEALGLWKRPPKIHVSLQLPVYIRYSGRLFLSIHTCSSLAFCVDPFCLPQLLLLLLLLLTTLLLLLLLLQLQLLLLLLLLLLLPPLLLAPSSALSPLALLPPTSTCSTSGSSSRCRHFLLSVSHLCMSHMNLSRHPL